MAGSGGGGGGGSAGGAGGATGGKAGAAAAAAAPGLFGAAIQAIPTVISEFGPAGVAQRKEFRKAAERLRMGKFGFSDAQKQGALSTGQQVITAQQQNQQADIARAQAGGQLAGGAATEAQRVVAQQSAAAAAQNAQGVQAASDAFAQQQHARDQATVDARAELWRKMAQKGGAMAQGADAVAAAAKAGAEAGGPNDDDAVFGKPNANTANKQKAPPPPQYITASG